MKAENIRHVAAIGAGRMGRGIAHVFAFAGYHVTLADLKPRSDEEHLAILAAAREEIALNLTALAEFGAFDGALIASMMDRIHFTSNLEDLSHIAVSYTHLTLPTKA